MSGDIAVSDYLRSLRSCLDEINAQDIGAVLDEFMQAYLKGGTVYFIGNGGSAATASHMACDLSKTASVPDKPRFKTVSLVDNIPLLTAIANDINYESIFSYQLESMVQPDDIVVAISGSGNSPNILKGVESARSYGALVIAFTGFGGGKLKPLADICINLESRLYGPVEDTHMILVHLLTAMLQYRLDTQDLT